MRAADRRDIVGVVLGGTVLAALAAAVHRGNLRFGERWLFRCVNGLPDALEMPLTIVMQSGTIAVVLVAAAVCFATGRRRGAMHVVLAGVGARLLADALKPIVGRARPTELLPDVLVRGSHVSGLGFPSAHSAVAASLAGALALYLPRWARVIVWCAACTVALARVYVGAHLPLDVIGGLALGLGSASLVHLVFGRPTD